MSKTIELLVVFSAGLAVGALSTRGYFEKKYRLRADEEIESVKHIYNENLKLRFKEEEPEKQEKSVDDIPKPARMVTNPYEKLVDSNLYSTRVDEKVTDYRKFYEHGSDEAVYADKLEEEMAEREAPVEDTKPYLISEEDFSETMSTYDKLSCTFYVTDRIVVDDVSREVIEPDVIGEDNIEFMIKTPQNFIYIRNENISCDMEISKNYDPVVETGDVVW